MQRCTPDADIGPALISNNAYEYDAIHVPVIGFRVPVPTRGGKVHASCGTVKQENKAATHACDKSSTMFEHVANLTLCQNTTGSSKRTFWSAELDNRREAGD